LELFHLNNCFTKCRLNKFVVAENPKNPALRKNCSLTGKSNNYIKLGTENNDLT
jgi:hypothetical protein